jgi:hypothetical protein
MQYLIRVKGHLDPSWQAWFAPLRLTHEATGMTTLSGTLPDQAALYGVLLKLDRLGLTLLGVASSECADGSTDGAAETAGK